jgi:catechol 2,3-dioxygenase-like lactoylglutathione lyase family enzyme
MHLQHLHLHVRDRAVAERFYAAWLGMKTQRRGGEITFMTDERDFLLALMEDASPAPMPPWFHFGFRVISPAAVLALHERMSASGVPIRRDIHRDESLVSFRCADPDGYPIEIYWEAERAGGSPPR